jgi:hypothetical protein
MTIASREGDLIPSRSRHETFDVSAGRRRRRVPSRFTRVLADDDTVESTVEHALAVVVAFPIAVTVSIAIAFAVVAIPFEPAGQPPAKSAPGNTAARIAAGRAKQSELADTGFAESRLLERRTGKFRLDGFRRRRPDLA